jgi:hypothetical protein
MSKAIEECPLMRLSQAEVSVKDSPLSAIPESMVPSATGIAVSGFGWLSDESEARCGLDFPLIALCN